MALTRGDAMRLDDADPLAAFRERFVIADEHRLYLDGNSLGRLPKGTRERLHRGDRPVGRGARRRLAGVDRGADAHRRRAGRGARREPRRGARRRLDHGQPLQARQRGAGRRPVAAHAGHRRRQLPDRPLRARGDRPRPRPRAARSSRPPTRCTARSPTSSADGPDRALATSPTAPARWPTWRRSTRRTIIWDLSHSAGRGAGRPQRPTASATPSAAPTSTSTPARARSATSTSRRAGDAAHADPGLVRPGRPVRDGAPLRARARHHAASSPARRRSSSWRRSRRACGSPPRRGSRRCARSRSRRPS